MLLSFIENQIREEHDTTIGVEFGAKNISLDDKTIKLQIWDTVGGGDDDFGRRARRISGQ